MMVHVRVIRQTKRLSRKKLGGSGGSRLIMVVVAMKIDEIMSQTVFVAICIILTEERFGRLNNW